MHFRDGGNKAAVFPHFSLRPMIAPAYVSCTSKPVATFRNRRFLPKRACLYRVYRGSLFGDDTCVCKCTALYVRVTPMYLDTCCAGACKPCISIFIIGDVYHVYGGPNLVIL